MPSQSKVRPAACECFNSRSILAIGKVYLVGAGPGHPQLLTLKAYDLIRTADILIYDRLIQEETLAFARSDVERVYVGKAPGRHQSRQDEINSVLVAAAHRGTIVVRLKGGDPVLFGRGGEEAEHLAENGIPFEVVPGVTAGLSVPMAAGIPVTHRDFASTVALVTGHRRDDQEMRELNWSALAQMDTLVFFMGVSKLPEISQRLMAHGRLPTTPAAVVQMAYWPGEQAVVGTLKDLPQRAIDADIRPPATIIVGEVVKVRDRLTTLHRDLRRDKTETTGFGLSSESLLNRLGSTVRSSKDLLAAVKLRLFDELEQAMTPELLAQRKGLHPERLRETFARLASLGLLLREEGAYRNAEAASHFLRTTAPSFIGDQLEQIINEAERYDPLTFLSTP
jgi:uroporphyrin-III C-methyltransferase